MKPNQIPKAKRVVPKYRTLTTGDNVLSIVAGAIYFQNTGQNYVRIDGNIVLGPREFHVHEDSDNCIVHDYSIEFITNPSPPTVDSIKTYAGDRLLVEWMERDTYTTLVEELLQKLVDLFKHR